MARKRGYLGNSKLKNAGENVVYTEDQTNEIMKCIGDPIYFIKNYMKIVNVDRGLIDFELWDFQEDLIKTINDNRFTICRISRQSGKCLESSTYVTLRNKKTNETIKLTVEEFYEREKRSKANKM